MKRKKRRINAEYIAPGDKTGRKLVGEVSAADGEDASVEFSEAPDASVRRGGFFKRLGLLWRMLWDKGYRTTPVFRTMVLLLPIWVISPFDLIPDFFFGIGLLDDLFAVFFTLGVIGREIDRYGASRNAKREHQDT
jgi:uncharacterized membrane protein YkvA (DUF1232 family)